MFENILWNDNSCTLKSFVENYHLPQLVRVEDGFYSENEGKTLSAGQILTLHFTKRTDKILAKASATPPFLIPVNCPCKVEILPTICDDRYYSVQDVVDATAVKFIRVVHDGPPSLGVKAGDILKIKKTVEQNRQKYIECEFCDKTRDLVRLPLEFKAAFEPLARAEHYHLQETLNSFKLPVRVKFISGDTTIQNENIEVDVLSLGSVLLKEVQEETTIIATSRTDKAVTVLMISADLDVSVRPAEGAITGDETYARFCKDVHDGANLEKVDLSLINVLRLCGEPNVEVLYDYTEMKPPLPPRISGGLEPEGDDSDSSEEYVEVPPPRPPRNTSLKPPPLSPKERGFGEVSKKSVENTLNWTNCQVPCPTVRTVSLQQSTDSDADKGYDDVRSDKNSPNCVHGNFPPLPIPAGRIEPGAKTSGSYTAGEDNYLYGDDDNDHDHYLDADSWASDDSDSDHDYIYPDEPVINWENPSSVAQGNRSPPKKSSIRERISDFFKKNAPKSAGAAETPSILSQGTSSASVSDKRPVPSLLIPWPIPPSPTALSSLSTSPSPTRSGQDLSLNFPDDLSCLSVSQVGECLRKLNMEKHVDMFESKQIDGELFLTLDEELLSSLGVNSAFEMKKIMKFINGWRPNTN